MRHTPTLPTPVKTQPLLAPSIPLYGIFCTAVVGDVDLYLVDFVVGPQSPVPATDGTQAFEGWFAEGWEGEGYAAAVAFHPRWGLLCWWSFLLG